MGLYQDPQTSGSTATGGRSTHDRLHRRHSHFGRDQRESSRTGGSPCIPPGMPRIYNKPKEISADTSTDDGLPGPYSGHCTDAAEASRGENEKDSCRGTEARERSEGVSQSSLQTDREDECDNTSHSTGPSIFPTFTDDPYTSPGTKFPELRCNTLLLPGMQGRAEVVGLPHAQVEWEEPNKERSRHDNRVRCTVDGLGSIQPGTEDRRSMDKSRSPDAHQLPGAPSSNTCNIDICKTGQGSHNFAEVGQHISGSIYQQPGGYSLPEFSDLDQESMDVVPGEEHTHHSSASARDNELYSRHRVSYNERPHRLEVESSPIQENRRPSGTNRSGLVCIQDHQPVPSLLQLAARSLCNSNRCISPGLVTQERVCEPSMVSDRQSSITDPHATSPSNTTGSGLEDPALVSSTPRDVNGLPTKGGPSSNKGGSRTDATNNGPTTSRMAHLRERYRSEKLSEEATTLLLKSTRVKTNRSYDSLFGKWHSWCDRRGTDPFCGPVSEVVNFLAQLFAEGYSYNSLNSYRSAISSVHEKVEGLNVGQHPLVTRLLKGAFNDRPHLPKYSSTWDVQVVLDHLHSLGKNETLSLKHMTWKTVMLLALTRPSRSADLSSLDLKLRTFRVDGVKFSPSRLSKQSRQGKSIETFFFPSYPDTPELCPVRALKAYEKLTVDIRGKESKLFLAIIKPHRAVVSSTIARWLRAILEAAGVDTSIFNAHSVRGASTSKAANMGVTTNDILKAANSVFQKFYHKPTEKCNYGRAVLAKVSKK